jgi:hypothetical protein
MYGSSDELGPFRSSVADPRHLDSDPDPSCHSDADADPDSSTFTLMQIRSRIQAYK